jgi:hypothetical protein
MDGASGPAKEDNVQGSTDEGWTNAGPYEALNVTLVAGGSIIVPRMRHAVETIDLIRAEESNPLFKACQ